MAVATNGSSFDAPSLSPTAPSSPPSGNAQDTGKQDGAAYGTVSQAMVQEEREMEKAALRAGKDLTNRFKKDREEDIKQGDEAMDTKFKRLQYLLGQSEVCSERL